MCLCAYVCAHTHTLYAELIPELSFELPQDSVSLFNYNLSMVHQESNEWMNERMSEWATEVTYTRGQVNGDHPTQKKIVKSTMFWKLDKSREARSDRAALDFRLKLVFILLASWG